MHKFAYFPSYVYRWEQPEWIVELNIVEQDWDNPQSPARTHSKDFEKDARFFNFKKNLEQIAYSILEEDGYAVDLYNIKVTQIWGQKMQWPRYHHLHVHGNTLFSGFYILNTIGECPYPIFSDPRPGKLMGDLLAPLFEEVKPPTQSIHFNNIIPGSLFVFNSWMPHQFINGVPEAEVSFLHFVITADKK